MRWNKSAGRGGLGKTIGTEKRRQKQEQQGLEMRVEKKEKIEMKMNEMGRNVSCTAKKLAVKGRLAMGRILQAGMKKEDGIDGILVTVGLCIIALLLCVVMKDSLKTFIETIVASLTSEAKEVLSGVTP